MQRAALRKSSVPEPCAASSSGGSVAPARLSGVRFASRSSGLTGAERRNPTGSPNACRSEDLRIARKRLRLMREWTAAPEAALRGLRKSWPLFLSAANPPSRVEPVRSGVGAGRFPTRQCGKRRRSDPFVGRGQGVLPRQRISSLLAVQIPPPWLRRVGIFDLIEIVVWEGRSRAWNAKLPALEIDERPMTHSVKNTITRSEEETATIHAAPEVGNRNWIPGAGDPGDASRTCLHRL